MEFTEEQRRLLWLSAAELSADRVHKMMAERGSAQGLWEDFSAGKRLTANVPANAVLHKLHSEAALDDLCAKIERLGVHAVFAEDDAYPAMLACIDDPPYVLYCMGSPAVMSLPAIAIVGTREPSSYGRNMAWNIASDLAKAGVTVVSGMARGVDGCAHDGAIRAKGTTVAVLGSGVNNPYPTENLNIYRAIIDGGGAVVSEYPIDAPPLTYHFPHRNRVISGMSHATVFVEGRVKSGGMITVGTALQQGRDVFAVPGCVGSPLAVGPHTVIREGARLCTSANDILADMGLELVRSSSRKPKQEALPEGTNATQKAVVRELLRQPMGVDELAAATETNADELLTELGMMEIMGLVRRESGNVFCIAGRARS